MALTPPRRPRAPRRWPSAVAVAWLAALLPAVARAAPCNHKMAGAGCGVTLPIQRLTGASGKVTGDLTGQPNYFGRGAGERIYQLDIPPGTASLSLSTCGLETTFDTALMLWGGYIGGDSTGTAVAANTSPWEIMSE